MKKNRTEYRQKRRVNNDAIRIPPWWYTGREVIDLDDDDWRDIPPIDDEPIPA